LRHFHKNAKLKTLLTGLMELNYILTVWVEIHLRGGVFRHFGQLHDHIPKGGRMASGHNSLVHVRRGSGAWAQQVHAEASGHLALLMKSCGGPTKAQRLHLHAPSDFFVCHRTALSRFPEMDT
jgi:hypothetical protein